MTEESQVSNQPRPVTPLGILVQQLEETVQLAKQAEIPSKVMDSLQHAFDLAAGMKI